MSLVGVVNSAVGKFLDLLVNNLVLLESILHVLTLESALDTLLLHAVVVLITSLLLHILHQLNVVVDLVDKLVSVAIIVLINSS